MTDRKTLAETILSRAFSDAAVGFASVHSLRLVASKVAPYAQFAVTEDASAVAHLFITESGLQEAFAENAPLVVSALGGLEGVTRSIAAQHQRSYEAVIDAASLIVAHSVVDSVAFECCRASAVADPTDWESLVEGRKISMGELKGQSYASLLLAKVDDFVASFERESLLKKVDRLFAICKPLTTNTRIYSYSRERLETLDNLRHSVVHRSSSSPGLQSINDDVSFLRETSIFLLTMVTRRYHLVFRPEAVMQEASFGEEKGS